MSRNLSVARAMFANEDFYTVFALIYTSGKDRLVLLGANRILYNDAAKAKAWLDNTVTVVNRCRPMLGSALCDDAVKVVTELHQLIRLGDTEGE